MHLTQNNNSAQLYYVSKSPTFVRIFPLYPDIHRFTTGGILKTPTSCWKTRECHSHRLVYRKDPNVGQLSLIKIAQGCR